jgi:hypothetical protein
VQRVGPPDVFEALPNSRPICRWLLLYSGMHTSQNCNQRTCFERPEDKRRRRCVRPRERHPLDASLRVRSPTLFQHMHVELLCRFKAIIQRARRRDHALGRTTARHDVRTLRRCGALSAGRNPGYHPARVTERAPLTRCRGIENGNQRTELGFAESPPINDPKPSEFSHSSL